MAKPQGAETIYGMVEIPMSQSLVEINKQTDRSTNNSSMDVVVTHNIDVEHFRFSGHLETDGSIIDEASQASFPRNSIGLTKKTIGQLIDSETAELREKEEARRDVITFRARLRTRIGIGVGFLFGGSFALTVQDAIENGASDSTLVGGALTVMIGGAALIIGGYSQEELTNPLNDSEIDRSFRRLTLLEMVRRASDRGNIKSRESVK